MGMVMIIFRVWLINIIRYHSKKTKMSTFINSKKNLRGSFLFDRTTYIYIYIKNGLYLVVWRNKRDLCCIM